MNRRSFLKTTTATAIAALVPTWIPKPKPLPRIDLGPFCYPEQHYGRYDMAKPFVQGAVESAGLFRYATDARVCVRVPATKDEIADADQSEAPPASRLHWPTADVAGWKPWPAANYLDWDEADCPDCEGKGGENPQPCDQCEGDGYTFGRDCKACCGLGETGRDCKTCKGRGMGRFPGLLKLGGLVIDRKYDQRIRRNLTNLEYRPSADELKPIQFCFAGGTGLVMGVNVRPAGRV